MIAAGVLVRGADPEGVDPLELGFESFFGFEDLLPELGLESEDVDSDFIEMFFSENFFDQFFS